MNRPLSVYLHIPFCVKKCRYCDFLSAPALPAARESYVQALCREMAAEAGQYKEHQVVTVFFGGGTPSLLSGGQLSRILESLYRHYAVSPAAEISMEMNPGTVTRESLQDYRRAGINRISIGLQSAADELLAYLGRIHTWADFVNCWRWVEQAGFANRNVDVMSALPGQSLEDCEETLKRVLEREPEHLSAYSLIVEEGTPFYALYGEGGGRTAQETKEGGSDGRTAQETKAGGSGGRTAQETKAGGSAGRTAEEKAPDARCLPLPDEDMERRMYERTGELLSACGYERYEISNYSRPGYECRHNMAYWLRQDYAGFGLGASSMVDNVRWSNTGNLTKYMTNVSEMKKVKEKKISLTVPERMEEFMFLGLRLTEGVAEAAFERTFGKPMEAVYGKALAKLEREELLLRQDGRVRLTGRGVDVSNYALAEFLF